MPQRSERRIVVSNQSGFDPKLGTLTTITGLMGSTPCQRVLLISFGIDGATVQLEVQLLPNMEEHPHKRPRSSTFNWNFSTL